MGTEKRERQKANRAAKQAAEAKAAARSKRLATIRTLVIAGVLIVVVMVLVSLAGCGSSGGSASSGSSGEDATAPAADACPPVEGVDEPVLDFEAAPPLCIDPDKSYSATIETSEGTVVLELDTDRTPVTTNNFVTLARYGYYDDTDLFRVEDGTGILQGGSPHTQTATDPGPGYTIDDEGQPFTSEDYAPGTIAMARTSQPDSAGAQFFLLANDGGAYLGDAAQLGPAAGTYAVFGQTTEGLDVLEAIAALGSPTGEPSTPVTIESVTITET